MTLQEQIAAVIVKGFGGKTFSEVCPGDDSLGIPQIILVHVEGVDDPIQVKPDDVIVPVPPFRPVHRAVIRLDVAALLSERREPDSDGAEKEG